MIPKNVSHIGVTLLHHILCYGLGTTYVIQANNSGVAAYNHMYPISKESKLVYMTR